MYLAFLMFVHMFPLHSNKVSRNVFSGPGRAVSRGMCKPSYNLLQFVSLSYMS